MSFAVKRLGIKRFRLPPPSRFLDSGVIKFCVFAEKTPLKGVAETAVTPLPFVIVIRAKR